MALHRLLERQHYRLGHWRLASSDINYRRFFDINKLAGLRVEDAGTFDAIHTPGRAADRRGQAAGLRLDHIDGLRDPAQYFQRLRRLIRDAQGDARSRSTWWSRKSSPKARSCRRSPASHGTTGYEWLNVISQVLVDGNGLGPLDEIWRQISNQPPKFEPVLEEAKRRVLDTMLASEFTVLMRLLARIAAGHYTTRDYSADRLRAGARTLRAAFPGLSHLSDRGRSDRRTTAP